jgi:hypothetical protein
MDFQGYLKNTYETVRRLPLFFILGGFVAQLLTLLSLSLLAGPFMGAYMATMILYQREGKEPRLNDLVPDLQATKQLFSFVFLLLIIMIGFMLLILPGIVFATWWMYTLPLMVDKKMKLGEAMRASLLMVNEKGFFMHLVFLLMITFIPFIILNFAAAILPLLNVLKILLPPLQTGCIVGLYLHQFDNLDPASVIFPDDDQSDQVRSLPEQ